MPDILSTSSSPLTSTGRVASSRSGRRSATSNSAFMIASGVRRSCEASATKRFWAATLSRMGRSVPRAYSRPPSADDDHDHGVDGDELPAQRAERAGDERLLRLRVLVGARRRRADVGAHRQVHEDARDDDEHDDDARRTAARAGGGRARRRRGGPVQPSRPARPAGAARFPAAGLVRAQRVARAAHRLEPHAAARPVQLAPQPAGVHVDDVGERVELVVPGVVEDPVAAQHLARVQQEEAQQAELLGAQGERLAAVPGHPRRRVEGERPRASGRAAGRAAAGAAACGCAPAAPRRRTA